MGKSDTDFLLRQVARGGGLELFISGGLHVSQIATLIERTLEAGLLHVDAEGDVILSEAGHARLAAARFSSKGPLIRPLDDVRREPVSPLEPYLPKRAPR